jgi:hypothetical protein
MKKRKNILYLLIIPAAIIFTILIAFIISNKLVLSPQEKACISSGGTITTSSCCGSVNAFPNTCTLGSCGCSPQGSHNVKSCSCGTGMCFNGSSCVTQG